MSLGITSAAVSCLVVPNPLLTDVGADISASAGFSTSSIDTVSGRDSVAMFTAELRLARTCDLRTTVEVISAQLTSPGRATSHYGRRNELTGRRNEIRLTSRSTATYVTLRVFLHYLLPLR